MISVSELAQLPLDRQVEILSEIFDLKFRIYLGEPSTHSTIWNPKNEFDITFVYYKKEFIIEYFDKYFSISSIEEVKEHFKKYKKYKKFN